MARLIRTIEDAGTLRREIEEFIDARWEIEETDRGRRVKDWHDWLDRFEREYDLDLGSSLDSPAILNIQRIVRALLRTAE